jgi:hypothetical protein
MEFKISDLRLQIGTDAALAFAAANPARAPILNLKSEILNIPVL